jgi:hypothetical protein
MKQPFPALTFLLTILFSQQAYAQEDFQPLHSLSEYNYIIVGELELEFSHVVNFKPSGLKTEGTYMIQTPIMLSFNLNDLKFFKAQPLAFLGNTYDEVLVASTLYPFEILEAAGNMKVDGHYHAWENGDHYEVKASAELIHFLEIDFNHASFAEKIKAGNKDLQFRLSIRGRADESLPQQNIKGYAKGGDLLLTEGFKLPVMIGCGTFYGIDYTNAIVEKNLVESKKEQARFEQQFESDYYKYLPQIEAMPLINYLINPQGNFKVPFSGSFVSNSESGYEKASYKGTLKLLPNPKRY